MHTHMTVQFLWPCEVKITYTTLIGKVLACTALVNQGGPVPSMDNVKQGLTIWLVEEVGN